MSDRDDEFLRKHGNAPVTWRRFLENIQGLAPVIVKLIDRQTAPLLQRIDALESELKASKSQTLADAYQGIWAPGRNYKRGDVSTHDGSVWLAQVDTNTKPGSDADWRLMVKKGRDGKDAR